MIKIDDTYFKVLYGEIFNKKTFLGIIPKEQTFDKDIGDEIGIKNITEEDIDTVPTVSNALNLLYNYFNYLSKQIGTSALEASGKEKEELGEQNRLVDNVKNSITAIIHAINSVHIWISEKEERKNNV